MRGRGSVVLHLPTVDFFLEAQQTYGNPAGQVRQAGSFGGIVLLTSCFFHNGHGACTDCAKAKFFGGVTFVSEYESTLDFW